MLSRPNSGISFSSPGFLVQCSIASSSGTRRQAGAALGVELRRMMTRFLLFHQTQDTTSRAPTRNSAFTVAVNAAANSIPSRLIMLKPVNANVTVYVPGRRSIILYCPSASVTTLRTFSMSAGLLASTVTPGSTAPHVSRTTPAMALCAWAMLGTAAHTTVTKNGIRSTFHIRKPPCAKDGSIAVPLVFVVLMHTFPRQAYWRLLSRGRRSVNLRHSFLESPALRCFHKGVLVPSRSSHDGWLHAGVKHQ